MVNVRIGEKAPNFTLPDVDMKNRSLQDFLGQKVILAFFVGSFTRTCTMEVCAFRDSMAYLTEFDAQVIGVSVNDPFTNKSFAEKNYLPYPILSDYNREVVKLYGLESEDYMGLRGYTVAKRSILILDQQGVIRYIWLSDNPEVEPNYDELKTIVKQIV